MKIIKGIIHRQNVQNGSKNHIVLISKGISNRLYIHNTGRLPAQLLLPVFYCVRDGIR